MTTLHLLRHAKTVPEHPDGDRARPLAERGEEASRVTGRWMREHRIKPAVILCSSALRTRQTLALLLPALGSAPEVLFEDDLYLAGARALLARLRRLPEETGSALVIGHNPGLHELAVLLAQPATDAVSEHLAQGFPTTALATLEISTPWAALAPHQARLLAFVTPKDIARERN